MRVAPVVEEVTGIYDQQRDAAQFFSECIAISDTPCQTPVLGTGSAAGAGSAASISREVYGKERSILIAYTLVEGHLRAYDLEASAGLLLGGPGGGLLRGKIGA